MCLFTFIFIYFSPSGSHSSLPLLGVEPGEGEDVTRVLSIIHRSPVTQRANQTWSRQLYTHTHTHTHTQTHTNTQTHTHTHTQTQTHTHTQTQTHTHTPLPYLIPLCCVVVIFIKRD